MTTIPVGYAGAITQNVAYALPASAGHIHASAAIEISVDNSNWVALTNANTVGVDVASGFIRCTSGNATVSFHKY